MPIKDGDMVYYKIKNGQIRSGKYDAKTKSVINKNGQKAKPPKKALHHTIQGAKNAPFVQLKASKFTLGPFGDLYDVGTGPLENFVNHLVFDEDIDIDIVMKAGNIALKEYYKRNKKTETSTPTGDYDLKASKFIKSMTKQEFLNYLPKADRPKKKPAPKKATPKPAPKKATPKPAPKKATPKPEPTGQVNLDALLKLGDLSKNISKEAKELEKQRREFLEKFSITQLQRAIKKDYEDRNPGKTIKTRKGNSKEFVINYFIKNKVRDKFLPKKARKEPTNEYIIEGFNLWDEERDEAPYYLTEAGMSLERMYPTGLERYTGRLTQEQARQLANDIKDMGVDNYMRFYRETKKRIIQFWEDPL